MGNISQKGFAEERWKDKVARLTESIRSLKESEEMLRQSAYSLRTENAKLTGSLAELQAAESRRKLTEVAPFKKRMESRWAPRTRKPAEPWTD